MPPSEKLIDRIKKLLRLGDAGVNPSESEVEAAVSKARQLMAEHALSMADLHLDNDPDSATIQSRMRQHQTYTRKGKLADYDYIVASAVGILTDTRWVKQSANKGFEKEYPYTKLQFWGMEGDVAIASELFFILLEIVRRRAREVYGSKTWDKRHTAYAVGFAHRLERRAWQLAATANQADADKMALVLFNKAKAVEKYIERLEKVDISRKAKKGMEAEWSQGFTDGASVSLDTRGVKGGQAIRTRNRG